MDHAVAMLVDPSERYAESFVAAEREFATYPDSERILDRHAALIIDFPRYVRQLLADQAQPPTEPGRVPASVFWLVDGDTYVGRVNLRHRLNPRLRRMGGHIGYEIRPSLRQKGYGTIALSLALPRARALGLRRVLLVCDDTNVGSARIIEANGGVLEGIFRVREHREPIRRYWIDLPR